MFVKTPILQRIARQSPLEHHPHFRIAPPNCVPSPFRTKSCFVQRFPKAPNPYQLVDPILEALRQLGGSGTNEEIYEKVIEIMKLPADVIDIPHGSGPAGQTELAYELAWARTNLRQLGKIKNPKRGVWTEWH